MQIVINIPEELYETYKGRPPMLGDAGMDMIAQAIANGTPLPKGHGDLKDMKDIYEALGGWSNDTGWIIDAIDWQAPTIIEADKAESEEPT